MVHVDQAANNTKKIVCLAEMACQTCQSQGITELSMIDHDISAKLEALELMPFAFKSYLVLDLFLQVPACLQEGTGNPVAFRYTVAPKSRVNVLEPKALGEDVNRTHMRYSMMGNAMSGNLKHLSGWDFLRVLWEASPFFCTEVSTCCCAFAIVLERVNPLQGEDQSIPSSHHASETEDVVSLLHQYPSPDCCAAWVRMFVSMLLMLEAAYFV